MVQIIGVPAVRMGPQVRLCIMPADRMGILDFTAISHRKGSFYGRKSRVPLEQDVSDITVFIAACVDNLTVVRHEALRLLNESRLDPNPKI